MSLISICLFLSILLNLIFLGVILRQRRWAKYAKSAMQAAFKMAKKTSDSLRFVRLEPWRDECVQNATDGIDNLFGILYGFMYPDEQMEINLEDTPTLPPPVEPEITKVPEDDEGEEWKQQ